MTRLTATTGTTPTMNHLITSGAGAVMLHAVAADDDADVAAAVVTRRSHGGVCRGSDKAGEVREELAVVVMRVEELVLVVLIRARSWCWCW